MTAPLCFLDCETTGLHPGRNAWEIAMIRRDSDGVEITRSFFIDIADLDLANADPFGLNVGKFWERHPQHTGQMYSRSHLDIGGELPVVLSAAKACRMVNEMTAKAHIVGAVPNFDTETLDKLLRAHNWLPRWHYHLIDVENLAVGYIAAQLGAAHGDFWNWDRSVITGAIQAPWSSDELGKVLRVEVEESARHTAYGDAEWAKRMYDRVMA